MAGHGRRHSLRISAIRLEAKQVDRCGNFQDVFLDVSLHHFAEDFLTFALDCGDK